MEQETDNGKVDKNAEIMIRERPTAAGVKANENTESVVITGEIMEQEADNGKIDKMAETAVDKKPTDANGKIDKKLKTWLLLKPRKSKTLMMVNLAKVLKK